MWNPLVSPFVYSQACFNTRISNAIVVKGDLATEYLR